MFYIIIFSINRRNAYRREFRDRMRNRNDLAPPARNDSIGRAILRIHNDLINLGRFLHLIRNMVILNNLSPSNNSTERSENPGEDIDFRPEKTVNIII